ncbi:MAG: hypothetical protein IJL53_05855 [Firmicutes bacterium]|nr:hypothetical protein [Bacillota bacterium]
MTTLQVADVRAFMNLLLLSDTFDSWGFQGASVTSLTQYTIDGSINTDYLTETEREARKETGLVFSDFREVLTGIIRSGRTPLRMTIVLTCPRELLAGHQSTTAGSYQMTIRFQDKSLKLISGISIGSFSMDRSDAVFWDSFLPAYLEKLHIEFTQS